MKNKPARRDLLKGGFGLAGVGLASRLASPAVVRAAGKETIRLLNTTGTTSLFGRVIFKELGLFEKYGVQVEDEFVSDGSKILAAIIGGSADMCGGSGFGGLFPAIQKGAKIKIIAGANVAVGNAIYASNKYPEIKSIEDLPGRTLAAGPLGALLYIEAVTLMRKYNVDYQKVTIVNIGSSTNVFNALVGGSVEAGVASVQYMDTADQYGIHLLDHGVLYEELPLFTNQAMFTSDEAIATKRDGLIRVMAAYADLFRWIGKPENKAAWDKYYKQALGGAAKDEEINFAWKFYGAPNHMARDLVLSKEQIDYVQQLNIDFGIQKAMVPINKAVDMSMAAEAIKLVNSKT